MKSETVTGPMNGSQPVSVWLLGDPVLRYYWIAVTLLMSSVSTVGLVRAERLVIRTRTTIRVGPW